MLKATRVLNDPNRNTTIDVFRGIAIIAVVVFHFNKVLIPFGYLGVDLFFVISGTLIGGLLIKQLKRGEQINFFKFFFLRGFKIWPSYYFFLAIGTLLAFYFYRISDPSQIIPLWDVKRYIFFYQNYTGLPYHWSFDHVWSLCVEEHFYIMLPILFIIVQAFKPQRRLLLIGVLITIVAGIAFKFISFYFTNSKDTYSATHNRIDGLAWGVLLSYIVAYHKKIIQSKKIIYFSILGLILFIASVYFGTQNNFYFNKVIIHSIIPFCFFLMLLGLYLADFSGLKALRLIAYYSYNWYLWHPLFVNFLNERVGKGFIGLLVYIIITLGAAILATLIIEEPILNNRKNLINRLTTIKNRLI